MTASLASIPLVISGPIVRHVASDTFTLWMATKESISQCVVQLHDQDQQAITLAKQSTKLFEHCLGEHCFVSTIVVTQADLFKDQHSYFFDVEISTCSTKAVKLSALLATLLYPEQTSFSFKFSHKLTRVLHGSCRKAHFAGKDALPQLDQQIKGSICNKQPQERPDLMLFTGDQVYVDDVAGPMLQAIHQVIELLGLYHEAFEGSTISHSAELYTHSDSFYKRENLLPKTKANEDVQESFFKGKRKPVFTSVNAHNHLIAFSEMAALYLLSWSSRLWPAIDMSKSLEDEALAAQYAKEKSHIEEFQSGLGQVERALAHIPIYMIFDDHDVTDDWNLTRAWEEDVYGNPFSKRIVGNALVAYLVFQGMGNPKSTWEPLTEAANRFFSGGGFSDHDQFIDTLLDHEQWQYKLDTFPPIQVLDTRTQRWRSESNMNKPSGLMDWEALCDLQQDIIGQKSVIMVSAAPIYGVKFIEAIQRLFITFGGALMVDAENWMAHRGTASVMLNIFRHIKTPPDFIILSGDVHYSFVYDISLRFRRNSPKIVQFTCSGIHNQFPNKLIKWFERLNRWFYGHRSPLNWLTKRRNMSIKEREARFHSPNQESQNAGQNKDIVNATSIGLLELNKNGQERACKLILADGSMVSFTKDE